MTKVKFIIGWLKFRGCRNDYWREDTIMWLCDHPDEVYNDQYGFVWCVLCGARLK